MPHLLTIVPTIAQNLPKTAIHAVPPYHHKVASFQISVLPPKLLMLQLLQQFLLAVGLPFQTCLAHRDRA